LGLFGKKDFSQSYTSENSVELLCDVATDIFTGFQSIEKVKNLNNLELDATLEIESGGKKQWLAFYKPVRKSETNHTKQKISDAASLAGTGLLIMGMAKENKAVALTGGLITAFSIMALLTANNASPDRRMSA
jgi:hypothetical protein